MTLSARIAALEGPERAVDAEVAVTALGFITKPNEWWPDLTDYGYVEPDGGVVWPRHGGDQFVPRFTASLDAAMSVATGLRLAELSQNVEMTTWFAKWEDGDCVSYSATAATRALALLSAALKARGL